MKQSKYVNRYGVLLLLFSLVLFWTSCKSKKELSSNNAAAATQQWEPNSNSLLWEITKAGKPASFIFGTVHMIPSEDYFLPDTLEKIIADVDAVYFEIDMDEMSDIGAQLGMLSSIMMTDGTSIEDLMSPADYKLVNERFESLGLPMFFLKKIKPMFLMMLLEFSPEELDQGVNVSDMKSYEMELNEIAQKYNKPTEGLETMSYQIGLFDSIPYTAQATMLVDAVKNKSDGGVQNDQLDSLYHYYTQQNIKMLYEFSSSSDYGDENTMNVLLHQRNKNWIPMINSIVQEKQILIAVGAGHLGGAQGVLALLHKEGYTVRPVNN